MNWEHEHTSLLLCDDKPLANQNTAIGVFISHVLITAYISWGAVVSIGIECPLRPAVIAAI